MISKSINKTIVIEKKVNLYTPQEFFELVKNNGCVNALRIYNHKVSDFAISKLDIDLENPINNKDLYKWNNKTNCIEWTYYPVKYKSDLETFTNTNGVDKFDRGLEYCGYDVFLVEVG